VDIQGTEGAELVEANRERDGSVVLELFAPNRTPIWRRRFLPEETREIRLYLRGGADSTRVRGQPEGIRLRVITGGGADIVADSTGGDRVRVYDDSGSAAGNRAVRRIVRPLETLPAGIGDADSRCPGSASVPAQRA
jgi:hypothetical protein